MPQTAGVFTHPKQRSNKKSKTQTRSGMSDGLMMLSATTVGGDTAGPMHGSQMSKAEFRNNLELLNHQ